MTIARSRRTSAARQVLVRGDRGERLTYVLPFVVVAALWQIASLFFPPFLFPSLVDVF